MGKIFFFLVLLFAAMAASADVKVGSLSVKTPVLVLDAKDGSQFVLAGDDCRLLEGKFPAIKRAVIYLRGQGTYETCWKVEKGRVVFLVMADGEPRIASLPLHMFKAYKVTKG